MNGKRGPNQNATTHGVFAQIMLKGNSFGEDREDFLRLASMFRDSIRPVDGFEETLVEKLAVLFFRLARLYKADLKVAPKMFERVSVLLRADEASTSANWIDGISGIGQPTVTKRDPSSDSITRYEANLEREIGRTLNQIELLRRMRGGDSTPALPAAELDAPDAEPETIS